MKKILQISLVLISITGYSQSDCETYDVKYVPIDLEDAFAYFECNWSKEDLETFKNKEEKLATISLHRGYGRGIRNGWGLWKREGKLVEFLNENGIYHPEDMSAVIFRSFHRKLNNKPIQLEEQAASYQKYWKEVRNMQRQEFAKEFEKFKLKDTLNFKYLRGYISVEQKALAKSGTCIAKGVLIEKRTSDFYLNVKVIESCDEKGLYTGLDSGQPNRQITKVGDTVWTFYNDWKPKID